VGAPMSRRGVVAVLSAIAAAALVLTGCTSAEPTVSRPAPSGIPLEGDYSGSGPGTLKTADKLATVDRRLVKLSSVAARITFESTSGIDGSPQVVSGSVFAPTGQPPPGGWPIIALGHGSTGVQHNCAPSQSPILLGATEAVAALLRDGFAVTMPDYQGLGLAQSDHPYLDATTAGYNMVDAVRAARKVIPNASDTWLATGQSQGGQAAWAANELANSYGAGLRLVGAVALAPAADITGLADLASQGKLTGEQAAALQWMLVALKNEHPNLNLDDYRHGLVREHWDLFSACDFDDAQERQELTGKITPEDLRPVTPAATDLLRAYLAARSLPKAPTAAPMLIVFGENDQLVAPPWTEAAVSRACEMGDVIESYVVPGRGHDDLDAGATLGWIRLRFVGVEALSSCDAPDGPTLRLDVKPWYMQEKPWYVPE
jgi:alpha-beta hydrolase superfamily lysophospholipase